MMRICCYLFIIVLFVACRIKPENHSHSNSPIHGDAYQTQRLIDKFKPMVQGVWVKKDYLEKVILTKSPLAAADLANGITTFFVNTDHIQGDSLIVPIGAGNHDGSTLVLRFNHGIKKSTLIFGGGNLGFKVEGKDTILIFEQFDEQKNAAIKTYFVRALRRQPDNNLGYGMEYVINKNIIAGDYRMTDSTGSIALINLENNGRVKGFLNFTAYSINIDLNSNVRDNLDEIFFTGGRAKDLSYSFKFNQDTLKLYETKVSSKDSDLLELGKLKYTLIRQR